MSKKRLNQEIKKITKQIVEKYKPEKIILFGSAVRGGFGLNSDLDLLLIKDTNELFWQRQKRIASLIQGDLSVDAFVLTPREIEKATKEVQPFIYDILHEGKVIYEQT